MRWGHRDRHPRERPGIVASIEHIGRNIARYDRSSLNDGSSTDAYARKDDAVRTDKNIGLNRYGVRTFLSPDWTPIDMGDDRAAQTDCAVIPDRNSFRMNFININMLADPNVLADMNTAPSV